MGKTGETGIAEGFFERSMVRYEDSRMKTAFDGKTSRRLHEKARGREGRGGVGAGKEGRFDVRDEVEQRG